MFSMRLGFVVVVVLLTGWVTAAATTWASGTGAVGSAVVCGPASARTLAADREARVYVSAGEVYGCAARGTAPKYLLGRLGSCLAPKAGSAEGAVGPVRVAGHDVAYASAVCGVDAGQTTVIVRRLSDGGVLHSRSATTTTGVEGHQDVGSLVVKSDGAVAWIATAESIGAPKFLRQVARLDRHGFSLLDSGAAVTAGSLTLRGSTVSWRHGSAIRSAGLD